ncbi:hypothetical protein, partial [Methylogaea oryzae]|uniref:hypothetical protein n=1 Tax=Methylogaea oryzae TaxID=1295382 RepID=UPI000ACF2D3B
MRLALAAVASYSGWRALVEGRSYSYWSGDAFAFGAIMAACWLLLLPFAQQRLDRGGWRIAYGDYFSGLLDNAARLAGAAAFAGAFWLLLLLAAGLSDVLGIRFVGKQIAQPYFIYSATALAFAAGLSLPQVKSAVYRGSLAALGWLLPLVSLIAALFLAALPFTGLQAL